MKQKNILIVLFLSILVFSMIGSNYVNAATLTIVPSTGNVGTSVTAQGTGYTSSGSFNVLHNNQALQGDGWHDGVFAQKFTGLTPGGIMTKLQFKVNDTRTSQVSVINNNQALEADGWGGNLIAEKFYGVQALDEYATINKVQMWITDAAGGDIRIKIYNDNGSVYPLNLIGESGSIPIPGTGLQNFTVSAPVPKGGVIWVAFEVDAAVRVKYTNGGFPPNVGRSIPHVYGSGPNPYGVGSDYAQLPYMKVYFTPQQTHTRIKIYNDGGTYPTSLISQTGSLPITGTGLQNFTVTGTIPANGTVWASFENNGTALLYYTNGGFPPNVGRLVSHVYGSGPNPYGIGSDYAQLIYMNLFYNTTPIPITIKYDGNVLSTSPGSIVTNNTGGFFGTFLAPASLIGGHTVSATDSNGLTDSKTFTITIPSPTSTISGSVLYSTSSLTPTISYPAPPTSISATKNQLSRNGTLVVTNNISPGNTVVGSVPTAIQSIGETMVGPSSYYVNTTLTDGANVFVVKSNTVILSPGTSPPSNGTKCGINGCPIKTVVTYSAHRNAAYTKLNLRALVIPIPFNAECNISNGTFSNTHRWYNFSGITVLNFNASVPPHDSAGYICYGSGVLFSGLSPGNQTVAQAGANIFNNSFGAIIGIPAGMFIVVLIGSLANQRTGPIYLIASLCVAGILATIGFFVLDTGWWAMSLIFGMLGLLVGRKVF